MCFGGPAGAAFWQRWFEGGGRLENQRNDDPDTGNFIDTFGNKMRVLAVANPKITHQQFEAGNQRWGKFLSDRKLKSEGYGLVRVNHPDRKFVLECWEWNTDPSIGNQFPGWPVDCPFDKAPV
jgi:alkaline phosphatase D